MGQLVVSWPIFATMSQLVMESDVMIGELDISDEISSRSVHAFRHVFKREKT